MQAERDHLVRFVFPKLRQELLQRRIHLVDVDLRWGVTSEQDALSVCREVVDECRPRFLCMLGGRYGWVPPGKTRSITADEVHYGVLDRGLTSRGFAYFYFRDPSDTAAMVEVAPREFREPAGSHGAVALDELKTAIVGAGLQPFIYRAQWDGQSRRLIGLKEFGDRVYADLKQSIAQEFGPTTGEKPDEFTEENAAMEAFIEERVQRFVLGSRQPVWNELRHHAESTGGNGYLCLTGAAGSGKSALLGKFCQDYRAAHPQDLVIPHFVGASPGSTDVRRTLRRLCHELVTGAGLTAEIPEDPEKLRVAFADILQQASAQKRVVILLDAINQFDPTTQLGGWSWLPEELPATARIILSTLSGPALDSLRQRRQPPRPVELQPLDAQDREAIIREFLHRYRKTMTDGQRLALLAKADAGTPLYLLVALEELRTLGTYEEITGRIAQLPPDTRSLFIWILKRLEDDDGFRDASGQKIGRHLVSRFVSLLGASRHGLSQQELVELLSPGDPQGNVAALAQLLRPYLMQRGELLDFYHGQFREAVATAYLPSESQRLAAHDQLATYFRRKSDPEGNQTWKGSNPRPFLEVTFHLVGAQRTDDYCQTLCDLRFVEARCRLGQVFELLRDCDYVGSTHPTPAVTLLRRALALALPGILSRPQLAAALVHNRLKWLPDAKHILREAIKRSDSYLDSLPFWLSATAPAPDIGSSGIGAVEYPFETNRQAITCKGSAIALVGFDGRAEIRNLRVGDSVETRELGVSPIAGIAADEGGSRLAFIDGKGDVRAEHSRAILKGRTGERLLAVHPQLGVLAVQADNCLVAWNSDSGSASVLAAGVSAPMTTIRVRAGGNRILIVTGARKQEIFLVEYEHGRWVTRRLPHPGPPVCSADLSGNGQCLLYATLDRRLLIFRTGEEVPRAEVCYQSHPDVIIVGAPVLCVLGTGETTGKAYLATLDGQIACWDFRQGSLKRMTDYHAPTEPEILVLMESIPPEGQIFVSTSKRGWGLVQMDGPAQRAWHAAPVSACFITGEGVVCSLSRMDQTVRWSSAEGGAALFPAQYVREPSAIAQSGETTAALMANQVGVTWRLPPQPPLPQDSLRQVFTEPVVSLFDARDGSIAFASRSGAIKRISVSTGGEETLCPGSGLRIQRRILPGDTTGSLWSLYDHCRDTGTHHVVAWLDCRSRKETTVWSGQEQVADIAVSRSGQSMCVAGRHVRLFQRAARQWVEVFSRETAVSHVAFLQDGQFLAVILAEDPWLEVWHVAPGMPSLAAMLLSAKAACLGTRDDRIVVGFHSGDLLFFRLRGTGCKAHVQADGRRTE